MMEYKFWNEEDDVPAPYRHLIERKAYQNMMKFVGNYFVDKGDTILRYEEGFLVVRDEQNTELKFGLDNLVRSVSTAPFADHESIVYSHFNKVNYSPAAYSFFFKDYEHAREHLKIVIKHQEVISYQQSEQLVVMTHFPGTFSILVFDYDNQLRYLRREDIELWEKSIEELFEQALDNLQGEEVALSTLKHPDGYTFYSFLSGDFASPRMIRLEENADFSIGPYGSLVLIPTKGASFAAPLIDDKVIERIQIIAPLGVEIYQKEPGNITTDFFWYYQGRYEVFPATAVGNGNVRVHLPKLLEELLKSSQV